MNMGGSFYFHYLFCFRVYIFHMELARLKVLLQDVKSIVVDANLFLLDAFDLIFVILFILKI